MDPSRFHGIVRWEGPPRAVDLRALGLTVLQTGPGAALVSGDVSQEPVAEPLDVSAKISPVLLEQALDGPVRFLAEFHADVPDPSMRAIADREGLLIREHPDLLPAHLMFEADLKGMRSLAAWDEVAYLWPASSELIEGQPARGCPGAISGDTEVGRYIARVGQGWDGAGLGAVELLYSIEREPSASPAGVFAGEAARALAEWSKWVKVDFKRGGSPASPRHLNFLFAKGAHGDPYPFDGRGKTLAHTFYPSPPNPEPLAGDLHFDDDENWRVGVETDMFSVVLHELGHALGLGHSDKPGAVMYPYYTKSTGLTAEDISAVRELYATRATPSTSGPGTPTTGGGGATPSNPAPATPSPDRVAPSITIDQPGQASYLTTADRITVRGTARDNLGVALITWWSNTAGTGLAAGTSAWSVANLPLLKGTNYIKITAFDAAGNSAWRTVVVTRR